MEIIRNKTVAGASYPQVMGILNLTPDSFSDGGCYTQHDAALRHTEKMIQDGAAWIDIGGESTRPGAKAVTEEEELARVLPVIEKIRYYFDVPLSIDTSKPEVIREAARSGVAMINDVRALTYPGALKAAAETDLPICLMHMRGEPQTMQHNTVYNQDIFSEVSAFFDNRIADCAAAGIDKARLLIDPGFGFGKNLTHNYQLLSRLAEFNAFGIPIFVGMSRKSMIGQLLNVSPEHRMIGSVACAVIAAMQGVHIIRVHDVKETVEALRVVEATQIRLQ